MLVVFTVIKKNKKKNIDYMFELLGKQVLLDTHLDIQISGC